MDAQQTFTGIEKRREIGRQGGGGDADGVGEKHGEISCIVEKEIRKIRIADQEKTMARCVRRKAQSSLSLSQQRILKP